ncbi:MAG: hypothetical protein WC807_17175 [Hyphomicrobium sp.]|jgi:hypothetical protein
MRTNQPVFDLPLLQAINDWQCGGDHKQKVRRGAALKALCLTLPPEYRRPPDLCYRQESHTERRIWQLIAENMLPETIAAWSTSLDVVEAFKGGVPPPDQRGIIFALSPEPHEVVVNLATLYADPRFLAAIAAHQSSIRRFHSGIGTYGNTQLEIVLDLGTLDRASILSYGGYAGSLEQLIAEFEIQHGFAPPPDRLPELQSLVGQPNWLSPAGTRNVVERTIGKASARPWWPANRP